MTLPVVLIKQAHVTCAVLTILSFSSRGLLRLRDSAWPDRKWLRIAPHVVDTLLLLTGLILALSLYQAFYRQPWLLAKLSAVIAYIVLGRVAIRAGGRRTTRSMAFTGCLLLLAYIVAVAVSKQPLPLPR